MTDLTDPASALVFTVGMNQRNSFLVEDVGSHERYMDALFNRGGESCRGLYERLNNRASPTRRNTDGLVQTLLAHGISKVVETNVICYSTPMSADLGREIHLDGRSAGREIFRALLDIIQPKVLVVHGRGAAKELGLALRTNLPRPPNEPSEPVRTTSGNFVIYVIPSLAPPGYNRWDRWAHDHLKLVARMVADELGDYTLQTASR
jgi:hypothetical protein